MSLVTHRKNGEGVPTPVWFAQIDDKLYFFSAGAAGKVKRIHNNPQVSVTPCTIGGDVVGESQQATARVLDEHEYPIAINALNKKYGFQKRLLDFIGIFTGSLKKRLYVEISPA